MTKTDKIGFAAIIGALALTAFLLFFQVGTTRANLLSSSVTVTPNTYQYNTFFASTTALTTTAATSAGEVAPNTTTFATSTNIISYLDGNGVVDHGYLPIAGAKKVTFFFSIGGAFGAITAATGTFSVQVSPDGVNWYNFGKLVQATSSGTVSNVVEQANTTLVTTTATSTSVFSMDLNAETYLYARCIVGFASATSTGSSGGAGCTAFATY